MASGKWNTFLNMIGLVDDNNDDDESLEQYGSGRYGRPSTYVPPRSQSTQQRRSGSATQENTRRSFLPSRSSGQSRPNQGQQRRTYGAEEPVNRRQTSSRFEEQPRPTKARQPFNPSPTSRAHLNNYEPGQSRPSRFEQPVREREREEPIDPPTPRRQSAPSGNRTVVLNLLNLRDANKVIASLVRGNTIVMTIETDDPMMRQRIVDTLSGAVYALEATIRRASESTYLLAPRDVDVQASYDVDERF